MPIIRSESARAGGYAMIANRLTKDNSITLEDKGLMVYFLSFPDKWIFHDDKIREDLATWEDGQLKILPKKTLEKCIKRLRLAGYVRRIRTDSPKKSPSFSLVIYENKTESPADSWLTTTPESGRLSTSQLPQKGVGCETTPTERGRLLGSQPTPKRVDISKTKEESSKTKFNNNSGGENFSNSSNGLTPFGYPQRSSHAPAKNGKGHDVPDNAEELTAAGEGPARSELHIKYEQEIGRLSEHIADELADMVKEYGESEVIKSIAIAADSNIRSLRYMRGVCKKSAAGYTNGKTNGNGYHKPADDEAINAILRRDGLI